MKLPLREIKLIRCLPKQEMNLSMKIILQKRIELWGEGYAWFDMKRLSTPLEEYIRD
jgi:hypothetical protein